MMDATGKQERHPIGIDPPDQRPDAERGPVWGNDLQADYGPGAKSCSGHDFRAVIADVHDLAGVALGPRFDDHRPGDSSSRMLPPISKFLTDHGLTRRNWRARDRNHREYGYLEVPDPRFASMPRVLHSTLSLGEHCAMKSRLHQGERAQRPPSVQTISQIMERRDSHSTSRRKARLSGAFWGGRNSRRREPGGGSALGTEILEGATRRDKR